jgi:hypothetical protein
MFIALLVLLLVLCLVVYGVNVLLPADVQTKRLIIAVVVILAAIYALLRIAPGRLP